MNISLIVKRNDDTNFIKIKYKVISMSVGSSAASTNCVLQTIKVGWDTEEHYKAWVSKRTEYSTLIGRETTGMQGKVGEFSVTTLDNISAYTEYTPTTEV